MKLYDYELDHYETLEACVDECTVLLKSNGDFPIGESVKDIALYGNGARRTIKGGTGSGEVNSRFFYTVEEGFREAKANIMTTKWLDEYDRVFMDAQKKFYDDLKAKVRAEHGNVIFAAMGAVMPEPEYDIEIRKECDTAVYVLSRISGEGSDRNNIKGDIQLSDTEVRDILRINSLYKKFMLVLNVGGPVDLTPVSEVKNILLLSQLGLLTGKTCADIIYGRRSPSGRLTTTWARYEDYMGANEFGAVDDTRYKEGVYVGYRYFTSTGTKAIFPFGYGLSYTTFDEKLTDIASEGSLIKMHINVTNTGELAAKKAVQIYLTPPAGKLDKPYVSLAAFAKTGKIGPGKSVNTYLAFDMADQTSYDEAESSYILEKGDYIVRLGENAEDTRPIAVINLSETVVVKKVKSLADKTDFADFKPQPIEEEVDSDLPVIRLTPEDIPTKTITYGKERPIEPLIKELTDEELTYMNIGAFDPKGQALTIIGNAAQSVAGAAGETCGLFKSKGVNPLIMADGPAGLRLCKEYVKDAKGVYPVGLPIPESFIAMIPKPALWLLKLNSKRVSRGKIVHEQYATAIPIGTAIAQSFNIELAIRCGDIVGDEMKRFGIHLWLAPALNIHRNIRCGRNFEYFSEDPLISGEMAAAITRGVQEHEGRGVTIKHYCANNQETNRYANNSIMSERTLRELYLRGFEICVTKSQPVALMSSYNLLNGVHTSERKDITEGILRDEWGYEGLVMTDWIISGGTVSSGRYSEPNPARIAASGNDVMMPGSQADLDKLREGLKNGIVTRNQLEINASRIIRCARRLGVMEEEKAVQT
ncbi:MAG: glycoside hydrolase family 3 C-terminal domain-containing protein [Lachnospiraceae bacterium]|nr:glycoside hydrolase family 3 C-terminal domain-containing protein [Lachnospiraceae bacterium]